MILNRSAPCKINLTLDVFAPRPDGFHELDSVVALFTPVDAVRVVCEPSESGQHEIRLWCSDATLPSDSRNLAYRAAEFFLRHVPAESPARISIRLEKHLPHQAGLGGGSSDAAAVLLALADCFTVAAPNLAAELGSDVPLFLADAPVRMRGRGERVERIAHPPRGLHGVLVKPADGVPTATAYALLDALPHRVSAASTPRLIDLLATDASIEAIGASLHNDFEAAILPAFPGDAEVHEAITTAGAIRALLCGSGAAVFGLARDADHAMQLARTLGGQFPYVAVAQQIETRPPNAVR